MNVEELVKHLREDIHNIRGPLSVIQMGIENLLDGISGAANPEQQRALKTLRKNVHQLTTLVDEMAADLHNKKEAV